MAFKIAISNHKGGVGKSTTTIHLADALSRDGRRVLVVDLDQQGNTSKIIGKETPHRVAVGAAEVLLGEPTGILGAIHDDTNIDDVCLIYGNVRLAVVDEKLRTGSLNPAKVLADRLSLIEDMFDFILIDCPPALSMLLANALCASDYYIIPLESGDQFGLDGMEYLDEFADRVRREVNPKLKCLGALLVMHNGSHKVCKGMATVVAEKYPEIFKTTISNSVLFKNAYAERKTALQVDRTAIVCRQYVALSREIAQRLGIETSAPEEMEAEHG